MTTTLGLLLGSTGGRAWACDKRGPNLRESWQLEIVAVEVEGEPYYAPSLVVGTTGELYRLGKKGTDIALTTPGMTFKKVSR